MPSIDWLLYSAIRKEALLTSQIECTQATLTDLFDDEAGMTITNTDDVREVTHYLRKLLEDLRIVNELTGQKKCRSFGYAAYVELLSR